MNPRSSDNTILDLSQAFPCLCWVNVTGDFGDDDAEISSNNNVSMMHHISSRLPMKVIKSRLSYFFRIFDFR